MLAETKVDRLQEKYPDTIYTFGHCAGFKKKYLKIKALKHLKNRRVQADG